MNTTSERIRKMPIENAKKFADLIGGKQWCKGIPCPECPMNYASPSYNNEEYSKLRNFCGCIVADIIKVSKER